MAAPAAGDYNLVAAPVQRLGKPAADARTASRDEDRVTGEFHSRIFVGAAVVW